MKSIGMEKMRRVAILISILGLCAGSVSAQIRESVVVVKPQLGDEGVAMYEWIAFYFRNRDLPDVADFFDGLSKGGYGSGFIADGPNGRSFVVTNRHVLTLANTATIVQSKPNGEEVTIEDCSIVYEDDFVDFALILLPEGAFSDTPRLELAASVPNDGTTVWSAGYPDLLGKPSWQFAKGVVTNRRVVVDSLGPSEYAVFTQHSAPIDSGNSGGPLLVGDPSNPSSFRIVGINTWVAFGRQNSNFAISLEVLGGAIKRCEEASMAPDPKAAVRSKAENLVNSLNTDEWRRFESLRYISSRMVSFQGWEVFTEMMLKSNDEDTELWTGRLLDESPVETLRQAIFFRMHEAIQKDYLPVSLESVEELAEIKGETQYRTSLVAGKQVFLFDWCEEGGHWRILEAGIPSAGISGPKPRRVKKTIERERMPSSGYPFPSGFKIGFGVTSVPTIYGWEYGFCEEIGYHFGFGRIASAGACLVFDEGASIVELGSQSTLLIIGIEAQGCLGIPIPLGNSTFFPYLGGGLLGGLAPSWSSSERWRVSIQAEAGIMVKPSSKWSVGFSSGPSFATDNQLRLESIPVELFVLYKPGLN